VLRRLTYEDPALIHRYLSYWISSFACIRVLGRGSDQLSGKAGDKPSLSLEGESCARSRLIALRPMRSNFINKEEKREREWVPLPASVPLCMVLVLEEEV
jgi:hypothetical protein